MGAKSEMPSAAKRAGRVFARTGGRVRACPWPGAWKRSRERYRITSGPAELGERVLAVGEEEAVGIGLGGGDFLAAEEVQEMACEGGRRDDEEVGDNVFQAGQCIEALPPSPRGLSLGDRIELGLEPNAAAFARTTTGWSVTAGNPGSERVEAELREGTLWVEAEVGNRLSGGKCGSVIRQGLPGWESRPLAPAASPTFAHADSGNPA